MHSYHKVALLIFAPSALVALVNAGAFRFVVAMVEKRRNRSTL